MTNPIMGILISFGFIFLIIGISMLCVKYLHVSGDVSRKIVHIGVGNWILFAFIIFDSPVFLSIIPICFIFINFLSYKFNIIKTMEQNDHSLGTVWYAVSLLVMVLAGYYTNQKEIAVAGILCMAYGDGFASVFGRKFGGDLPLPGFPGKSIPGFLAMFFFSLIALQISLTFFSDVHLGLSVIWIALVAALMEASSKNGYDNLSVPIWVCFAFWVRLNKALDYEAFVMFALTCAILIFAFRKKSISASAGIHAFFVASALFFFSGWLLYLALILFFILGSILSKIGNQKKQIESKLHSHTGAREVVQVYANAGVPVLLSLLFCVTNNPLFLMSGVMAFAGAMADTASSEIGMLSKEDPISLIGFRKMEKGLSGGVTLLGLISGVTFSFFLSLLLIPAGFVWVVCSTLVGLGVSILDSLLGQVIQVKYIVELDHYITEKQFVKGKTTKVYSGFRPIDNNMVNFLSVLIMVSCVVIVFLCVGMIPRFETLSFLFSQKCFNYRNFCWI